MEAKKSKLDKILAFSLDMICTIDVNGRFEMVSAASLPILGYECGELVSQEFIQYVHPDDRATTLQSSKNVMNGSADMEFENRCIRKDGHIIPILWSLNWDSDDKIMYCIARDGTAKKQSEMLQSSLEESNKRYNYVSKATSDAIWDWDIERGTLYWGEGFINVFGHHMKGLNQDISSWSNHVHPEDVESVVKSVYRVIDSGENNWEKEYRFKKADGSYVDVIDRGFIIRNALGQAVRMVGAMHDISERKKAITDLKKFSQELYQRNSELQQFGYVVSHNLRSPIANIMGIADLMELERDNAETIDFCIKGMRASINSLDEVIKDLSKILSTNDGRSQIDREEIDVIEILNKVKADLDEWISKTNAVIEIPQEHCVIVSQKAYMYSVFYNLLSNAMKYRSGERPRIKVKIQHKPDSTLIRVEDNGIGIDLKRHGHDLFKPYKRFNDEKDGKGLGLFLVKGHIEALQGTIEVESEPGKGTAFEISFPDIVIGKKHEPS